jgi:hypothetical protein
MWGHRAFDPAVVGSHRRLVATLLVVLILGSAQVWVRLQVRALGYRVQGTTALIERLDHEHSEVLAEVQREKSPGHLIDRVRRLGLDVPKPGQVVTFEAPEP